MLDSLGDEQADLVTHDIGNMVGYAFAAEYPQRVRRFVLIDAPIPALDRGTNSSRVTRCGTSVLGAG